ncbi:MAG: hypothetical protein WDN25_09990 [Acetobacteraceae bacterium]
MIAVAAAGALLLSVGLLCVRRLDVALPLLALQSACAAATLGHVAAIPAFALGGVVLPLAMAWMRPATALAARGGAVSLWLSPLWASPLWASPLRASLPWAGAVALPLAAIALFARSGSGEAVAAGVSVVALGLWLVAMRRHALATVLGLLAAQNGLVLVAGAYPDLPPTAAFAVAVPLLPALALADAWLHR